MAIEGLTEAQRGMLARLIAALQADGRVQSC
jgi:hypothetical protein